MRQQHPAKLAALASGAVGAVAAVVAALVSTTPALTVSPTGNDATCSRNGSACQSWNVAYLKALPGDTVSVGGGTYPQQAITHRNDLDNLTPSNDNNNDSSKKVKFSVDGNVTLTGSLEIHGSDIEVNCNNQAYVKGYIDTEADSNSHPDHVVVKNCHSVSVGSFNVDTANYQHLDVGPATTSYGGGILEGEGIENKIGSAGGNPYAPNHVTWDDVRIHDQNGDAGRQQSGEHFGGLFIAGVNDFKYINSTMEHNVVYNIQIQPINGAPITNVNIDNDSFACPVNWLYQNSNPLACDGQSSIQFDGDFPTVKISNSVGAEGGKFWGCYTSCASLAVNDAGGNDISRPPSVTANPLLNNGGTTTTTTQSTTTAPTTTQGTTTTTPTKLCNFVPGQLSLSIISKTSSRITVGWNSYPNAAGYRFYKNCSPTSSTFDGSKTSVTFSYTAGTIYSVAPIVIPLLDSVKG